LQNCEQQLKDAVIPSKDEQLLEVTWQVISSFLSLINIEVDLLRSNLLQLLSHVSDQDPSTEGHKSTSDGGTDQMRSGETSELEVADVINLVMGAVPD